MTSRPTPISSKTNENLWLAVLYFAFAMSGFCALVYQVAWQRVLGLFSGSDSISSAIVVGSFLLGLGLGSLVAGWVADRLDRRRAFFYFAWCEVGIALFGLVSKPLYYDWIFKKLTPLIGEPIEIFGIVFVSLLIPTVLMGISLPILSRAVVRDLSIAPRRIGGLYGVNTLGAAIGAFVSGWFLIGHYGYETTIEIAVLINLMVGAIVMALSFVHPEDAPHVPEPQESAATATHEGVGRPKEMFWHWCFFMFLSGFLAISLEIVWFRIVGVILQGSPYGFSLVLAVFLAGDALGIVVASRWADKIKFPRIFFIRAQASLVIYAVLSILLIYWLYGDPVRFSYLHSWTIMHEGLGVKEASTVIAIAMLLVFPPAILMGLSFPVVHKAIQNDACLVAKRVGLIQLFNILGNTSGSIITGLVVFAFLGTANALVIASCIAALLMLLLIWEQFRFDFGPSLVKSAALLAALVAGAFILPDKSAFWSRLHFPNWTQKTFVHEDHSGVALLGCMGEDYHILSINGREQGYVPFNKKHIYCSIFSLIHPNPQSLLLIGFGTGGQAFALSMNDSLNRAEVVELIRPVYQVMRDLADSPQASIKKTASAGVKKIMDDPRFVFGLGDGRRTLFSSPHNYDIIQTDAVVPVESHSGLLFSIEFFQQIRAKLNPGGIAIEWAPTQRAKNGFLRVFPHVLQIGPLPDLGPVLIGSEQPLAFDKHAFIAKLRRPEILQKMAEAKIYPEEIIAMIENAPVTFFTPSNKPDTSDYNTDLLPKDEFFLNNPVHFLQGTNK